VVVPELMPLRWSSSLTRHKLGLLLSAWATAVAPSSSMEFDARSRVSRRVLVISMRAMCLAPSAPRIVSRKSKLCTVVLCASRFASCRVHMSRLVCVCNVTHCHECHVCNVYVTNVTSVCQPQRSSSDITLAPQERLVSIGS
jgi:hypothetical protein